MRTQVDALRSVARYASEVLGPEWEVRLWDEKDTMLQPFARVTALAATTYEGSSLCVDVTQPLVIHCVPVPQDSVEDSIMEAKEIEDGLFAGFRVGVGSGGPARIPLYDFDGVPLGQMSDKRHPNDYLRVSDFGTRLLHDPEDDRRVAVICDLRVSYRRMARVHSGQVVKRLRSEYDHTT